MRNIRFHVLIGLCAVANLLAQTDRGVITGTVKDVSGAVVPGAQVTAIQTNTNANFKTKTTTSGDFTVPSLPVGTYQVRHRKKDIQKGFPRQGAGAGGSSRRRAPGTPPSSSTKTAVQSFSPKWGRWLPEGDGDHRDLPSFLS